MAAVESGVLCGARTPGPAGTEAAAVPASRNRAEAVAMTKRFM